MRNDGSAGVWRAFAGEESQPGRGQTKRAPASRIGVAFLCLVTSQDGWPQAHNHRRCGQQSIRQLLRPSAAGFERDFANPRLDAVGPEQFAQAADDRLVLAVVAEKDAGRSFRHVSDALCVNETTRRSAIFLLTGSTVSVYAILAENAVPSSVGDKRIKRAVLRFAAKQVIRTSRRTIELDETLDGDALSGESRRREIDLDRQRGSANPSPPDSPPQFFSVKGGGGATDETRTIACALREIRVPSVAHLAPVQEQYRRLVAPRSAKGRSFVNEAKGSLPFSL